MGLVDRIVEPTTPVSVRYRLTERGRELLAALQPLARYGLRWESPHPAARTPGT
jgi:DNA-binding HxlR family transcriptional regulator